MLSKNTKIRNNIYIKIPRKYSKQYPNLKLFFYYLLESSLLYLSKKENLEIPLEISLTIVDETTIKKINAQYRNKNKATDVLSFSLIEGENIPKEKDQPTLLGDIVICLPVALRQSIENQHSLFYEFARLLVHGIYHLLGYDHERSKEEEKLMQKKEKEILQYLLKIEGIKNLIA